MQNLIGRAPEIQILIEALMSSQSELIAIYGRRRVGKTHLVRTVYGKNTVFELSGLKDATLAGQLENFSETLTRAINPAMPIAIPGSWMQAFRMLINFLETTPYRNGKQVVFLDEFPWLDTPRSGFLPAFDHFWNNWASRQSNLAVVICGSAASWMIHNIVRNKGGLHNRITRRIRLLPFNLYETELFLQSQRINLDRYSILQLYMTTGGIPQYLKDIRPGESAAQAIDRLCFTNDGWLRDEFKNLYPALFDNADKHIAVVRALSDKPSGLTRTEILAACQFPSGGSTTKIMEELLESGFIVEYIPFNRTSKDAIFKLGDEYSLFYLKFIENSKSTGDGTWLAKSAGAAWSSWSGLAFENVCLKHVLQIKKALGISGVYTEQSIWRYRPKDDSETGVQIDLLLDRKDNCINLIEIKFSNDEFMIDKKYAVVLRTKRQIFTEKTGTRKSVFLTMLTTFGVKNNDHYLSLIQNQLTIGVLFGQI
ncbi:MAG TPA: ATP-binding protein [Saprospiraceae bacterium]|nr:ATP-binding protein [Saprospiraceae bacterium]